MKLVIKSTLLVACAAGSILAQSEAEIWNATMNIINQDPHCGKCFAAMPCIEQMAAGQIFDNDAMMRCQCNEEVYSIYESDCLTCSFLKQSASPPDLPSNLADYKKECTQGFEPASPSATNGVTDPTGTSGQSSSSGPAAATNATSDGSVFSPSMVTYAALSVVLLLGSL